MRSESDLRTEALHDDSLVQPSPDPTSWRSPGALAGRRTRLQAPAQPVDEAQVRVLEEHVVAWRRGRTWHLVELARIPECTPGHRPYDVVASATIWTLDWYASALRAACPHDTYATSMRPLRAAECRKLGLAGAAKRSRAGSGKSRTKRKPR